MMANFTVFLPFFLMTVWLTEGVGGAGQGGVGGGKNPWLGHPMRSHDNHTMVHATLVGTEAVGANLGPHHPIGAIHWCCCSSHDFGG